MSCCVLASQRDRSGFDVVGQAADATELPALLLADVVDTLERIAKGASVVDPALVQELVWLTGAATLWRCSARASRRW
jgi:hypothetical protein